MLELIEIGNKLVGRKRQVVAEKVYKSVFLQMKNPNSARLTQCPFCKTPNYAVEYRGVKTKEEKGIEQVEEQRVIEAKIRMMENEKQDYEDKLQKRMESCSSSISAMTGEFEQCSASVMFLCHHWWLPIVEPATRSSSSGGLKMVDKSSNHNHNVNVSSYSMLPGNYDIYYNIEQETDDIDDHHHHNNHYHNSNEMGETGRNSSYVSSYMNGESFHNFPPPPPPRVIALESFAEQIMMAMAVPVSEVHATTTSAPAEVSWQ
ncbi:hypothetical protein Bca52824_082885 [Brassica carinata]|uniref:Uncharacterized protein n=1 Tax=Brassica carinata TaxID=52824 RepID=A0A8X7TT10_BRACI|nr:hypothetical protein Bca52824_082885 [Brassica carinata]